MSNTQPSQPSQPPPLLKKILIIGTGSIGERHLRCFQSTGRAVVAACEPVEALRSTVAEQYNCPGYASLEEAGQSGGFDAAIICTPAHTHLAIARECVERGWHILIEKPLAVSLAGVGELKAALAQTGRMAKVAYVRRADPLLQRAKELLGCDTIGNVRHITLVGGQHFPTFRPAYRDIYYASHATGGGAIQDALTHSIDAIEWLAGPIRSLYTDAAHQVLEGVEVEDTVNLLARIEHGAWGRILVSATCNQFQAPNENILTCNGDKGSLRIDFGAARLGLQRHGEAAWAWEQFPKGDRDAPFIRQANAFLDALEGRPSPLATVAEAEQTLRVNIAALQSAKTGSAVTL